MNWRRPSDNKKSMKGVCIFEWLESALWWISIFRFYFVWLWPRQMTVQNINFMRLLSKNLCKFWLISGNLNIYKIFMSVLYLYKSFFKALNRFCSNPIWCKMELKRFFSNSRTEKWNGIVSVRKVFDENGTESVLLESHRIENGTESVLFESYLMKNGTELFLLETFLMENGTEPNHFFFVKNWT